MLIELTHYRLDRLGRGGHTDRSNQVGIPGCTESWETHEHYDSASTQTYGLNTV